MPLFPLYNWLLRSALASNILGEMATSFCKLREPLIHTQKRIIVTHVCMPVQNYKEEDIQHFRCIIYNLPTHRNVLVGEGISVKISDFGLSRSLAKENTYYHLTQTKKLPVKWMALESLLYRKFSTYSDGKL